jgi:demethylmenaquinone methyltransferase/2-methoxy-6-polyprenyl-1,4-benzoquinol methylase
MMKKPEANAVRISRVTRSKAEARSSYDTLSRWYDTLAASERRFAAAGVERLAPATGERVLEIGYGTGWTLVALARLVGSSGRVHGLDLSPGMRVVAERRLRRAGLAERVELTTGDACALPHGPACMDAVFMSFTLELFDTPEIPVVLAECARVLVPGGRICVVAMAAQQPPGIALRLYEWAHERFPRAVDCRPIHAAESLEAAGFTLVSVERRSTWGLPLDICLARK